MQVYSHSYWLVIFCTTNSSREVANFREFWEKNTIFNENPVVYKFLHLIHIIYRTEQQESYFYLDFERRIYAQELPDYPQFPNHMFSGTPT